MNMKLDLIGNFALTKLIYAAPGTSPGSGVPFGAGLVAARR